MNEPRIPTVHDDDWPQYWARQARSLLDELNAIDGVTASLSLSLDFERIAQLRGRPAAAALARHLGDAIKDVADMPTLRDLVKQGAEG